MLKLPVAPTAVLTLLLALGVGALGPSLPSAADAQELPRIPDPLPVTLDPSTTAFLVGTAANGAVLYTSFGANVRGYTVVVAEDGISATTDFEKLLTRYQLLNQPGFLNSQNRPLEPQRVTLSRTDLISFE